MKAVTTSSLSTSCSGRTTTEVQVYFRNHGDVVVNVASIELAGGGQLSGTGSSSTDGNATVQVQQHTQR